MQANPEKCQVLAVGKKTFNKSPYFTMEDHWKMSKNTLKERWQKTISRKKEYRIIMVRLKEEIVGKEQISHEHKRTISDLKR